MDELDKDHKEDSFTKEDLELGFVSTALLFFFAGFDTVSTTLSLVVHALIHHPDIQERLRDEVKVVIGEADTVTADHLQEMKNLETIINESIRRYFPIGKFSHQILKKRNAFLAIQRVCTKEYKVPNSNFTIPKGMMIHISPRKTDCFANPEKFDLENFIESDSFNKFGFNSFGQGPRSCIGKLSNSLW